MKRENYKNTAIEYLNLFRLDKVNLINMNKESIALFAEMELYLGNKVFFIRGGKEI